jgi:hypothetical protein
VRGPQADGFCLVRQATKTGEDKQECKRGLGADDTGALRATPS